MIFCIPIFVGSTTSPLTSANIFNLPSDNDYTMSIKNVLIIDDDEIICTLLQFRLQQLGHQTFFSLTSTNLERLIERYHPAILILDIFMPEKDGIELISELKLLPDPPYIIAISSHHNYLNAITRLGADEAYRKDQIDSILQAVIKRLHHLDAIN